MRRRISRVAAAAALAVLPALLAPTAALAQGELDVAELGRSVRQVAKQSIPKTVLVKSHVGGAAAGQAGYGSGAIISEDGYIITCSHVVDIAVRIEVALSDGTFLPAKLLGQNKRQDYAMLKVETDRKLPFFELADSTTAQIDDWMVALGHPGGPYPDLRPAVSLGKVTALNRQLPIQGFNRFYNDAIQTDCPIFAGNSGGPLVNLEGKLVGLNGAILLINENAYTVPMNEIVAHMDQLKAGEAIEGVAPGPDAFSQMQDQLGPQDMQKLFGRLFENFGQGEQGENPFGDLFKQFFGGGDPDAPQGENPMGELFKQFFGGGDPDAPQGENPLGELFKQFFGGGDPDAPQGENPMGELFKQFFGGGEGPGGRPAPPTARGGFLGVQIEPDSDERDLGGVLVQSVQPGSPAEKAGIENGDVIKDVDGAAVKTVADLQRAVGKNEPGAKITVKVVRARILDTFWVQDELEIPVTLGSRQE